jgi:hypothetical protein
MLAAELVKECSPLVTWDLARAHTCFLSLRCRSCSGLVFQTPMANTTKPNVKTAATKTGRALRTTSSEYDACAATACAPLPSSHFVSDDQVGAPFLRLVHDSRAGSS